MMDKVIIDTSVWIESFRPSADQSLHRLVKDLILSELVLLPGIIKTELLRGAKNKKEFNQLNQLLKGLAYLAVHADFWESYPNFHFNFFEKEL
jgi:predicted nucleic acid-binding protein